MKFIGVDAIRVGDKIVAVEFRCVCGYVFDTKLVEAVVGERIGEISQMQCPSCGKYSGFNLRVDKRPEVPGEFKLLCTVLTRDLRFPITDEVQLILVALTTGRNLQMNFSVAPES